MNTMTRMKDRIAWVIAAALLAILMLAPIPTSGAAFPQLANPKQIPSCTSALLSGGNLTKKTVGACVKMVGRAYVSERCSRDSTGYVIALRGWHGIPSGAATTWGLRVGQPASRLTALSYDPSQLRLAACGSRPARGTAKATTGSSQAAGELPMSVESDAQMQAEGNNGPSSSILLPISCQASGTTVTAKGTTQGFSESYVRYGDIIVLYLFTAPSSGYPEGAQLAVSSVNQSSVVGPNWQVSTTFDPTIGQPARCSVAAQPTHDEQLAP
jgi:hypothetical protein